MDFRQPKLIFLPAHAAGFPVVHPIRSAQLDLFAMEALPDPSPASIAFDSTEADMDSVHLARDGCAVPHPYIVSCAHPVTRTIWW
jgi:hypothetical protein